MVIYGFVALLSCQNTLRILSSFVVVVKMSGDYFDRSSDIREVLEEIVSSSDEGSDIEAENYPSDFELEDFSSGSGEIYEPSGNESSSDDESRPIPTAATRPRPTPGTSRTDLVLPTIALQAPTDTPWVRVIPPEPEKNIENDFLVRSTGAQNLPPRNANPLAYFMLFFSVQVLNHIVRHTNYYAQAKLKNQRDSGNAKQFSRLNRWVDVTYTEIKKYLAILINMGLTRRKNMKEYWDSRASQVIAFYHNTMSLNRFLLINSNLHLTMKATVRRGHKDYDPWVKVRFLYDHLNATFKRHFIPSQSVCIDESMIGMKNRSAFIQYMPNKKHARYGIKKFEACDSKTGYIMHTEIYSGNDLFQGDPNPFTEKVLLHIMQKANLLDKNYHLFTDQFYTKYPTAKKLFDRKTHLTGTINKRSKYLPKDLTNHKLAAKESIYFRKSEVLLVGFKQKATRKPVYLLTTACHAEDILVRSKKGLEGVKPCVIHKYNQDMGGVDVSDKSIYHTSCSRSTSKYWKKIFFNFIDMSLYNSYILYKANTDKPKSRKHFIIEVLEELALEAPEPLPGPAENTGEHALTHMPGNRLRQCAVCETKNKTSRSRFWCPGCNCGVHRECFAYLQHFWRPTKFGRKRKEDEISDSD